MDTRTRQEEIITLMYQVMRQMRKRMDISEHDQLSPYHLHALFTLSSGQHTMGELAEELSVSLPSATSLANRLVEHEWVDRQSDPTDRRVIRLALTATGVKVLKKAKELRYRKLRSMLDAMPEEDLRVLQRIFQNLHSRLTNEME